MGTLPSGRRKLVVEPVVYGPGLPMDTAVLAAEAIAKLRASTLSEAPPFDVFARYWYTARYERGDLGRRVPTGPTTLRETKNHVDVMVAAWKARAVDSITFEDVRAVVDAYPGAASWKNRLLMHARALFTDAQRFGLDGWKLRDNPATRVPLLEEDTKQREQMRFDEVIRVLRWMKAHRIATTRGQAALMLCGLRLNEVRLMHVERVVVGDEYAPCAGAFLFDAEHRKERRPIAIPYPKEALEFFEGAPADGRWCYYAEKRYRRELRAACEAVGVDRDITPHGLRGSWATFASDLGVPKTIIMLILGQASERVLDRHYLRLGEPAARAMMANVGRGFAVAAGAPPEGAAQ
jgi:integrase